MEKRNEYYFAAGLLSIMWCGALMLFPTTRWGMSEFLPLSCSVPVLLAAGMATAKLLRKSIEGARGWRFFRIAGVGSLVGASLASLGFGVMSLIASGDLAQGVAVSYWALLYAAAALPVVVPMGLLSTWLLRRSLSRSVYPVAQVLP